MVLGSVELLDQILQDAALTGGKRTAVLALLQVDDEAKDLLLAHTSEFADQVAFAEEARCRERGQGVKGLAEGCRQCLHDLCNGMCNGPCH